MKIEEDMCSNILDDYYSTPKDEQTLEHTGGSSSYYDVEVHVELVDGKKRKKIVPALVSCNLIIEALNMNYAQATVFKAVWRICASKLGRKKRGNNTVYDAEKITFFAERILVQEQNGNEQQRVHSNQQRGNSPQT